MKNSIWLNRWKALWNPERYHGWGRSRRYFEGWYYKCVSADESEAFAFIPGIARDAQGESHAFIQVMDGHRMKAEYFRFPADDFHASADHFEVTIGANRFSDTALQLDMPGWRGAVRFQSLTPWPKTMGAPGIMGWYSFVPFMECNHGVVSLNHGLEGDLQVHDRSVHFNGGKGYIEKDWGRSFPRAYIWLQTNHFEPGREVSLMASVAHIPWMNSYFIGFICGFWLDGRLFKFATYSGAKKYVQFGENEVRVSFQQKEYRLEIHARQQAGVSLVSPLSGAMTGKVNESLLATAEVTLKKGQQVLYSGTGRQAGLELAGDLSVLAGD